MTIQELIKQIDRYEEHLQWLLAKGRGMRETNNGHTEFTDIGLEAKMFEDPFAEPARDRKKRSIFLNGSVADREIIISVEAHYCYQIDTMKRKLHQKMQLKVGVLKKPGKKLGILKLLKKAFGTIKSRRRRTT